MPKCRTGFLHFFHFLQAFLAGILLMLQSLCTVCGISLGEIKHMTVDVWSFVKFSLWQTSVCFFYIAEQHVYFCLRVKEHAKQDKKHRGRREEQTKQGKTAGARRLHLQYFRLGLKMFYFIQELCQHQATRAHPW